VATDAPCADFAFLTPLKRSQAFRDLRPRLAGEAPHPVYDSWQDNGFHFFVFVLADGVADPGPLTSEHASFAVFAMHAELEHPVSAVTIIPVQNGDAEITDLLPPGGSYVAPYPLHQGQLPD
jgi:hypothetical protein